MPPAHPDSRSAPPAQDAYLRGEARQGLGEDICYVVTVWPAARHPACGDPGRRPARRHGAHCADGRAGSRGRFAEGSEHA
jgi:hypothetical protein